jgi:hypothetical protein
MRPLAKSFEFHSSSGRLPGTIRPFKKKPKKKNNKKSIKKKKKKRKRGRVFTIILLYKTYYTKSKENKFSNAFAP